MVFGFKSVQICFKKLTVRNVEKQAYILKLFNNIIFDRSINFNFIPSLIFQFYI